MTLKYVTGLLAGPCGRCSGPRGCWTPLDSRPPRRCQRHVACRPLRSIPMWCRHDRIWRSRDSRRIRKYQSDRGAAAADWN